MKSEILDVVNGSIKIPSDYLLDLEIGHRVLCIMENGELILRPFYEELKPSSKELLDRLREKGFEGEELLLEYKRMKRSR